MSPLPFSSWQKASSASGCYHFNKFCKIIDKTLRNYFYISLHTRMFPHEYIHMYKTVIDNWHNEE